MDYQDIRTLKILEELDKEHVPSQRDLAKELNVSLGLVNSFIKRMVHKGYFKITTIPANRVKYMLTPIGAAEKTRLTYEYVKFSFEFYKTARKRLRTLFAELTEQGIRSIVFWGATDLAEIAFLSLQEFPIAMAGIIDRNKIGNNFFGKTIIDPADIEMIAFDKILITSLEAVDKFAQEISEYGLSEAMVVKLSFRSV